MKTTFSVCVLLPFLVFSAFGQEQLPVNQTTNHPCLVLKGTNTIHFGDLTMYGLTGHVFRVSNTGNAPLKIARLVPTCAACISGSVDKPVIPPGEDALVTVRLNPMAVRGKFRRGLWIYPEDPAAANLSLWFTGNVLPLITGVPEGLMKFDAEKPGDPMTNVLELAATETGVTLGAPEVSVVGDLGFSLTIVTNRREMVSYSLRTVSTPRSKGKQTVVITLPVIGRPNMEPLRICMQIATGLELSAVPKQLPLVESKTEQTFRLTLTARNEPLAFPNLSWEPRLDGIQVSGIPGRKGKNLLVTVRISPQAASDLLKMKEPALRFSYPKYVPVTIPLSGNVMLQSGMKSLRRKLD